MSEKQIDKRVLSGLREWIGVGAEQISDDELWNNSSSVRARLEFYYACKDFGDAIMQQFHRVIKILREESR